MPNTTVLHLTSVHPHDDVRIFHKECVSLAAAGYTVTLAAPGAPVETINGVRLVPFPSSSSRLGRVSRSWLRGYLLAKEHSPNVLHIHDPELVPAGMCCALGGTKVIYDAHEDLPLSLRAREYLAEWLRVPIALAADIAERLLSIRFAAIIAATPAIAQRFNRHRARMAVVHNFPRLEEFPEDELDPYPGRPNAIAYIGAISEERGALEMLEAVNLVPPDFGVSLELAGAFSPDSLKDRLETTNAWRHARYHGTLTRRGVFHLLRSVRAGIVLLHPSPRYLESYPVKLFEYMAAALPVVASDFPLWRRIVEGAKCGLLVDPCSPLAVAEAIQYILEHPSEAETMGRRGREAAMKHYNWKSEEHKLLELYNSILG